MKAGLIAIFTLITFATFAQTPDTTRNNPNPMAYTFSTLWKAIRAGGVTKGAKVTISDKTDSRGGPGEIVDTTEGFKADGGVIVAIPGTKYAWARDISQASRINVMWFGAKKGVITDTSDYTNDTAFARGMRYCFANNITLYIPHGKFYLHHILLPAISIYEDVGDNDGLFAMQNVRDTAFLNITPGHLSNINITGLRMFGNPLNTHQHGFDMTVSTKTGITGGGGLWNSNFTLCDFFNFTGAQMYWRAKDSLGQDFANQFLTFEKCRFVRPDNADPVNNPSYCMYIKGQTGQINFHVCEFDGKVANTSKGINIYFDGRPYASNWTFDHCTIQNSEYGAWMEQTRGASFRTCWFENVSKPVTAMNFALVNITDICQFRNSGHAADGSGYIVLNNNANTRLIDPYIISSGDRTAVYINPISRQEKGNFLTFSTNVAIKDSNSLGRITGNVDSSITIGGMAEIRAISAGLPICFFKNDQHPSMSHLTIVAGSDILFKADTTSHGHSNFFIPTYLNDSLFIPQGGAVQFVKGDSTWLYVNHSLDISRLAHKGIATLQTVIDSTGTVNTLSSSVILLNARDTVLKYINSRLGYGERMTIVGFGSTKDSTTGYTTIVNTGNISLGNFGVNGAITLRRFQTITLVNNSLGTNQWMVESGPATQKSSNTTTGLTEYVTKNEIIWNSAYDSTKTANLGWVVTRAGVTGAVPPWTANNFYQSSVQVAFNNNVYKSVGSGTSGSTAPTHTSGTAVDGTVTWLYTGKTATFQPFYASNIPIDTGRANTQLVTGYDLKFKNDSLAATKIDSFRRVGTNVQMLKNSTWTTVYTDSVGTGGGGISGYTHIAKKALTTTPVWDGTAPTTPTQADYEVTQIGQDVWVSGILVYSVAGVSNTNVTIPLPSDCPAPEAWAGRTGASNISYLGAGQLSNDNISASAGGTGVSLQVNTAGTGWQIVVRGSATAAKTAKFSIKYTTP